MFSTNWVKRAWMPKHEIINKVLIDVNKLPSNDIERPNPTQSWISVWYIREHQRSCGFPAASRCLWAVYSCWFHNKTLSPEQTSSRRTVHITLFFGNQLCEWVAGCVMKRFKCRRSGAREKICHDSESTVTNYRPCSSTPYLLRELRVSAFS